MNRYCTLMLHTFAVGIVQPVEVGAIGAFLTGFSNRCLCLPRTYCQSAINFPYEKLRGI